MSYFIGSETNISSDVIIYISGIGTSIRGKVFDVYDWIFIQVRFIVARIHSVHLYISNTNLISRAYSAFVKFSKRPGITRLI